MKKLLSEFKDFIQRGNVMDMAVGVIIGIAFGAIVTSLVNDIIMPPVGLLLGNADFSDLYINLSGTDYASLSDAKAAGAAVIAYGAFINTIINFLIIALAVFFMIRFVNNLGKLTKKEEEAVAEPTTKECPFCLSSIAIKATRCPNCTSQLDAE
ncbi:MAG TPA: large conductance mechanosensitive channel protein MscL [Dehalococcoidia bacterium]|nr:large conductance mechanosensitive channel protein MscL [Dehalococcoidia bacterium]